MDKKGVEISMNVLIVAAIGLLVLVVLAVIFLTNIKPFSTGTASCEGVGGRCATACGSVDAGTQDFTKQDPLKSCSPNAAGENQVCCLPI